jgi:hypothetical protein
LTLKLSRALEFWEELRGHGTTPPPAVRETVLPQQDAPETLNAIEPNDAPPAWGAEAITGRTFVILYSDSKGQASERQVLCRRLVDNGGTLYLHAYCYARDRIRTFRADRISSIVDSQTGEVHEPGMALLRLFLPASTSAAPFRYGLSPQQYGDFNAALNVLTFMARCDGEWHPLEREMMQDFAAAYWLRADIRSALDVDEVSRHADRLAPDAETFWVSLQRCADHPILSQIIRRHISAVVDADGMHHRNELYWGSEVDDFLRP